MGCLVISHYSEQNTTTVGSDRLESITQEVQYLYLCWGWLCLLACLWLSPDWNISITLGWIDVKFSTDICGLQRMKPTDVFDLLTFPFYHHHEVLTENPKIGTVIKSFFPKHFYLSITLIRFICKISKLSQLVSPHPKIQQKHSYTNTLSLSHTYTHPDPPPFPSKSSHYRYEFLLFTASDSDSVWLQSYLNADYFKCLGCFVGDWYWQHDTYTVNLFK